jgi:homoserine O-acetyltransferase
VIVADPIGNGLSTSPSNSAAQPACAFPRFALRDMVEAQHRLLTGHLGVERCTRSSARRWAGCRRCSGR